MLFRKPAQDSGFDKKNAYIETLADNYLDYSFKQLGDLKVKEVIKGKFSNLKYTLSGYDPSDLSYADKIKLISVLFTLNVSEVGRGKAKEVLEKLGVQVRDRLGVIEAFKEGIKDLPRGVFELQKIEESSEEELKERLRECVVELGEAHENTNGTSSSDSTAVRRDLLDTILYNTSDGIFALDGNGEIIAFNQIMEELTGYRKGEAEKRSVTEIIRLFDDNAQPLETNTYCALPGVSLEKVAYTNNKLTLVARNGSKKYVRMTSSTVSKDSKVDIGCVVTLKDVTQEVELDTMKLDFVSMAAHELRTPLTSMRGYLSFLNDGVKKTLDEDNQAYIEKAMLSADRLHILIENLLNISRIERGNLVLDRTSQDWIPIVKSVVERFEGDAEGANLKLIFTEPKERLPKVVADKVMVAEILSNLLDNAIRYTPEGGRITVSIEQVGDTVVTHVKDTGIGIPQASIPHLFKKFYRVSTVLKEGKKGTGLGLFISKEIVKLHKGDIWVESTEGDGSTFSFSLPISDK